MSNAEIIDFIRTIRFDASDPDAHEVIHALANAALAAGYDVYRHEGGTAEGVTGMVTRAVIRAFQESLADFLGGDDDSNDEAADAAAACEIREAVAHCLPQFG